MQVLWSHCPRNQVVTVHVAMLPEEQSNNSYYCNAAQGAKAHIAFVITPAKVSIQKSYCCHATQGTKAFRPIFVTMPKEQRQVKSMLLNIQLMLGHYPRSPGTYKYCCCTAQGHRASIATVVRLSQEPMHDVQILLPRCLRS